MVLDAWRRSIGITLVIALVGLTSEVLAFQTRPAPKVEKVGPFALGPGPGRRLTVVANYQPVTSKAFEGEDTVTSWTIQDAAGVTLFREVLDSAKPEVADVNTIRQAAVLVGQGRRFLVVEMDQQPSAPGGGEIYFIFGFDRAGKLRQLARLVNDGESLLKSPGPGGGIRLADGRYFDIGDWTGWFTMIHRYEYDETREEFISKNRCAPVRDATFSSGMLEERIATRDKVIALHRVMDPASPAERIPVTLATKVQLLQACFVPSNPSPQEQLKIYFLQIRIDGKEGWIEEEDFFRIGLQQAG